MEPKSEAHWEPPSQGDHTSQFALITWFMPVAPGLSTLDYAPPYSQEDLGRQTLYDFTQVWYIEKSNIKVNW